jgi:hypothetical protein
VRLVSAERLFIFMIEKIVRRARRRYIVNEGLRQSSFAAAVAAFGLVLLLIAGTRFLEWWTILVFAAAGIGVGVWRLLASAPSDYAAAVQLDEHAQLHDALSTAFHFANHPNPAFATFAPAQRRQAEDAAGGVNLATAVPFTMPRALYAMAGLGLLASGLVFLRYEVMHTLDLRQPLTEVLFEDQAAKQGVAKKGGKNDPTSKERLEAAESLLSREDKPPVPQEQDLEAMLDKALEAPEANQAQGDQKGGPQDGKSADSSEKGKDGDPMEGPESQDQQGDKNGKDGKAGDSKNGKENSSLMDKLKEAMSNMMSKKDGNGDKQQGGQQPQSGKNDKGAGEKSASQKGQKQDGQSQAGQENSDDAGDAQKGEQAQGQASDKAGDQKPQAGSGQGSQDGAKDIKAAEQLKAMGKLSEILGKRAQQVSGETSIEVESGAQSLRTAYKDQTAAHSTAESEVTRDEIPLDRQSFVQQYFEQVHKPAAPKTAPKNATPKP